MTSSVDFEDIYEAMRAAVRAIGGNKAAGQLIFPAKPMERAQVDIANCCNAQRSEKLDPEQLLQLAAAARREGCDALMHFMAHAAGYELPRPRDFRREADDLERGLSSRVDALLTELRELKHLKAEAGE